jgi:hypothetical protein
MIPHPGEDRYGLPVSTRRWLLSAGWTICAYILAFVLSTAIAVAIQFAPAAVLAISGWQFEPQSILDVPLAILRWLGWEGNPRVLTVLAVESWKDGSVCGALATLCVAYPVSRLRFRRQETRYDHLGLTTRELGRVLRMTAWIGVVLVVLAVNSVIAGWGNLAWVAHAIGQGSALILAFVGLVAFYRRRWKHAGLDPMLSGNLSR